MKKVVKFQAKDGNLFNSKHECLQHEAQDEIQQWIDNNTDEEGYLASDLVVKNFDYLVELVDKIKKNTVREIPDEDGGL